MQTLPAELLSHVCTFLGKTHLANLALTSHLLLAPARWQLFTSVTLRSDSPFLTDVILLLLKDPQLVQHTVSLTIETHEDWGPTDSMPGATWVAWNIVKKMKRLRTLRFKRLPCIASDGEAKHFITLLNRVYKYCPDIVELMFADMFWPIPPDEWTLPLPPKAVDVSTRPRLQRIEYKALFDSGSNWTFLVFCLFMPTTFITHLDLFVGRNANHLTMFRTLSFPALRTLYLRSVPLVGSLNVVTFLVTNPSIRHLYLIDVRPQLPVDKMVMTMLPTLKTLQGSPSVITRLASRCDSVRYIQALILDYTDDLNQVRATDELVTAVGGFPNLLHCSLIQVFSAVTTTDIVRLFSKDSALLTYWTGGFYYHDFQAMNLLGEEFAQFTSLTRIDVYEWTYPDDSPQAHHLKGITAIAAQNPEIKKLCLYMPHLHTPEISTVYMVERLSDVSLRRTYQCFEGGPYIQERRRVDFSSVHWEDEALLEGDSDR